MSGRGRMFPVNNVPRGVLAGPPSGPSLGGPLLGPHFAGILPPLMGPPQGLPNSALQVEQKLATQHAEIQRLLTENQRLAATHVALRQEVAASQQEIQRLQQVVTARESDKDQHIRALLQKSAQMETDICAAESVRVDLEKLHSERRELLAQVHKLTQESHMSYGNSQQVAVLRSEVDNLQQELQQSRMALEQERKVSNEYLEQRQVIEKNMISMAKEVEKLRIELSNFEKRAYESTSAGPVYNSIEQAAYENGYPTRQGAALSVPWPNASPFENKGGAESGKYPLGMERSHIDPQVSKNYPIKSISDIKSIGSWSMHLAPNGKLFYYNSVTGVTQWEKPAALAAVEAQALSSGQIEQVQMQIQQAMHSQTLRSSAQQPSQSSMQQGAQQQAPHTTQLHVGQHPLAQMQSHQSVPGLGQSPPTQIDSRPQAQLSDLIQAHFLQQPQIQSTWQGQVPSNVHAQYSAQQHLDRPSYVSRLQEGTVGISDRHQQTHQLPNVTTTGALASDVSVISGFGATPKHVHTPYGVNLLVWGIPDDYNDQNLEALFRPYGTVLYAKVVPKKDNGQVKCYGSISMDSPEAAEAAIDAINGLSISGRHIKVEQQHEEREPYFHQLHQQQLQQNLTDGGDSTRWYRHNEVTAHQPY